MYANRRIQGVYEKAEELTINHHSKIVLMSDCHRGTGSGADNFAKNQNLFYTALSHYDREGFTYIELGDGDELWENRSFPDIAAEYEHVFSLISRMYREGRFHMLWGNHDAVKKREGWCARNLSAYQEQRLLQRRTLFPGIRVREGLRVRVGRSGREILLLHGHQADFFNDRMWRLSKTLVRYLWRPLELVGMNDPFSSSVNPKRRIRVERLLAGWSDRRRTMLVAGHTHRPIFPRRGESLYFNDGSGVHPRMITAIELENYTLSLVKWEVLTRRDGTLYIGREVLEGPVSIEAFYRARDQHLSPL